MTSRILVTGVTGNVGQEVARALQAAGQSFRAGDLNVATIHEQLGREVEAVRFDYCDPKTFAPAFYGVERVFLMRPPAISAVRSTLFPAIDAARAAGVRHVVFLSLVGIEHNRRVPHYPVEQYLRASGFRFTFLRASFFMQNLSSTHRAEIRERRELFIPAGRSKTSFIDVRDIGAVGALALSGDALLDQAPELTGPEALDYYQVAAAFSQALGVPVQYRDPSLLQFVRRQLRAGTPLRFALVMALLYWNTRRGMASRVTSTVQDLLGRPPIPLTQYIADYRDCWLG